MGSALQILLDGPITDLDFSGATFAAVANSQYELDAICGQRGLAPLVTYCVPDPEALLELFNIGPEPSDEEREDLRDELTAVGRDFGLRAEDAELLTPDILDEIARGHPARTTHWFDAADGLRTVRGLLAHVQQQAGFVGDGASDGEAIARELRQMECVLSAAGEKGMRFRLSHPR